MNTSHSEFSRLIRVEELSDESLEKDISPNETERKALADRFDLLSLDALSAHLELSGSGEKGDILLSASFSADVTQRCVVTLKPVKNHVEGHFSCHFTERFQESDEDILEIDVDAEDPPEPILNGEFDVGEIVIEHFGLELDPFPRQLGIDFEAIKKDIKAINGQDDADNPFAVLKKLK